jgi:hypothetical protein
VTRITPETALNAYPHLRNAADAALLHYHTGRLSFRLTLTRQLQEAAAALGYAITPIPQPYAVNIDTPHPANTGGSHEVAHTPSRDPDSGRASSELGAPETALPALNHNYGA